MFHPILIGLLIGLLALLALSVGYRPERSAVGRLRAGLRTLQGLARRDPERYGPALALHLRLLSLELRDSGRPIQALMTAMTAVDLIRGLIARGVTTLEWDLAEAIALEDALREAAGLKPGQDLLPLAEAEEDRVVEPARSEDAARAVDHPQSGSGIEADGIDAPATVPGGARYNARAYLWQIALTIWLLSVGALLIVGLFGG
ncbi:MAG: hypothetical protein ACFB6R_00715 [Alphaproteobacteria bacterium]